MEKRTSIVALLALVVTAVLCTVLSARASAQCPEELTGWAAECVIDGEAARLRNCPQDHVIFEVGVVRLGIDVELGSRGGFERAGALGLSPMGEHPDWRAEPEATRAAFAAFATCVRDRGAPLLAALDPAAAPRSYELTGSELRSPARPNASSGQPMPWAALVGLLIALATWVRMHGLAGVARTGLAPAACFALTFVGRLLVMPMGYFHQNGQGPIWVAQMLDGTVSSYGPGYQQLFGALATTSEDPDGAVFVAQALLAAAGVAAAFVVARRLTNPVVAAAVALAVATHPILMRLAHSESYFAAQGSLLLIATAVLVTTSTGAVGPSVRDEATGRIARRGLARSEISGRRTGGAFACALLLSQVVLIHPVAWIPAATVPLALLALPGPLALRLLRTLGSALVCGGVIVLVAFSSMMDVLEGRLGAQWLSPAGHHGVALGPWVALAAIGAITFALHRARYGARVLVPSAALAIVAVIAAATDLLGPSATYIHLAYFTLFAGPVLALALALLPARRWLAPAAVVAVALLVSGLTASAALRRPTDAIEGDLARGWREHLPSGAIVAFMARADRRVLTLPLHRFATLTLTPEAPPPNLDAIGAEVFWYRSAMCATEEARAYCDAVEAQYELTPILTRTLPAIPSIDDLTYDEDTVVVGLYRVVGRR
jgi:hypothetical protein